MTSTSMLSQLLEMQSVPRTNIHLFYMHYALKQKWTCKFESEGEVSLKISCDAETPETAVAECYKRWQNAFRYGVPEAAPSLIGYVENEVPIKKEPPERPYDGKELF